MINSLPGILLIIIGILHTLTGVRLYSPQISEIWKNKLANSMNSDPKSLSAFWFFFSGFLLVLLGQFYFWIEVSTSKPVPAFLNGEILFLSLLGGFLMPKSGFWLVALVAIYGLIY